MITTTDVLLGGVIPGLLAAITLAVAWKLTDNIASSWRTAVVVSLVAGIWALDAQGVGLSNAITKSVRTTQAKDFLPLLMILAIVPDAVAAMGNRGAVIGWWLRVALCFFVPWRLIAGSKYLPKVAPPPEFDTGAWGSAETILWISGIAATLLAVWSMLGAESTAIPRLRSGLAVLAALGAATTVAMSGSLIYGQLLGATFATLAGCAIVAAIWKLERGPDAAAGPVVIGFGSVLVLACFFAELKLWHAGALLIGLAVGAGWFFPGKKWANPVRCALCLIAVGVAVISARIAFAASVNPYQNL